MKWIPCQTVTSVLCLLFHPETVHCSTKNAYTTEITLLALVPCFGCSLLKVHSVSPPRDSPLKPTFFVSVLQITAVHTESLG